MMQHAPTPSAARGGVAIDTVVVDYGGVLTNPLVETLVSFATRVGVGVEVLGAAFVAAAQRLGGSPMAALETGRITEAELVRRLVGELPPGTQVSLGGRTFGELWFEGRVPNEEFLGHLRTLRAAGYRLALLTNNVREWEHRWRAQIPVAELFALVVNSAHEGVRKPDPAIYQVLLDRLGARPQQCLFVDDTEENCATARSLGMATVRFTDTASAVAQIEDVLGLAPLAAAGR